ncbi:Glutamate receptor ionotropic, NMDA 2C like [Actinidia chinensis var. chinensis]|uniref:Glutamate receptor ionotropic, NMDA 2C like n=1 Tax=Actinidia chinensis var. chinensis TaxID=1590841 RepID=A0A2R6QHS2_ACTCC|nr:Glutamate receptor ionotropic, NMDA 2C like [Actinidia chinensis var. chinensis]
MASGVAGDGLLRGGMLEGCVFGSHTEIRRRPYHRNCSCALHKSRGLCAHASGYVHVLYPIRRTWSEGCLALTALSSRPTSPPCPSPTTGVARTQTQLVLCEEE